MHRRVLAAVFAACSLAALTPPAAPAAQAGPPELPKHCFLVYGPPEGPVGPLVGATLCVVDWARRLP
jgi:hypothetical protein